MSSVVKRIATRIVVVCTEPLEPLVDVLKDLIEVFHRVSKVVLEGLVHTLSLLLVQPRSRVGVGLHGGPRQSWIVTAIMFVGLTQRIVVF